MTTTLLATPYEGRADDAFPPFDPGWIEASYEDGHARAHAARLTGLPPYHYVDDLVGGKLYRFFAFESALGTHVGALTFVGVEAAERASLMGDATQDGLDLTMLDRAQTLMAAFAGGSVTSAPNGDVTNFQAAWNLSTPGQKFLLKVDGKYGPNTRSGLQQALQFPSPTTQQVIGGVAPQEFNYRATTTTTTTTATPKTSAPGTSKAGVALGLGALAAVAAGLAVTFVKTSAAVG